MSYDYAHEDDEPAHRQMVFGDPESSEHHQIEHQFREHQYIDLAAAIPQHELIEDEDDEERSAEQIQEDAQAVQDAAEESRDRDDEAALSLVGAIVGDYHVVDRVKRRRWYYVALNTRTGREVYLRGHELVRQVRATERNGGVVVLPNGPWRNEGEGFERGDIGTSEQGPEGERGPEEGTQ